MVTGNPYSFNPFKAKSIFPDVSACNGITINIRSRTQYNGYYISFGTDRVPGGGHAMGYKVRKKRKEKKSQSQSPSKFDLIRFDSI